MPHSFRPTRKPPKPPFSGRVSLRLLLAGVLMSAASAPLLAEDEPVLLAAVTTPVGTPSSPAVMSIANLIAEGKVLFSKSEFTQAETLFSSIIERAPDNAQGYYWLGQIYIKQGKTEQGLGLVKRSVEMDVSNSLLWQALGQAYVGAGQLALAEQAFQKTITLAPKFPAGHLDLGRLYISLQRDDAAIDALERVMTLSPQSAQGREALSRLKPLYEKWVESVSQRQAAGEVLDAAGLDQAIERAKRLVMRNALSLAQTVLDVLIKQAPDNAQAQYWRGQVAMRSERFDEGLMHLRLSTELAPDNLLLRTFLGSAYEQAGKEAEAKAVYRAMIPMATQAGNKPLLLEAQRRLGLLRGKGFMRATDYTAALEEYKKLRDLFPRDIGILVLAAEAHEKLGQFSETDRLFAEALTIAPDNYALHMNWADSFLRRGELSRGQAELKLVMDNVATGPVRQQALSRLGYDQGIAFIRVQRYDEALKAFDGVLAVAPDEPLTNMKVGLIYFEQQKYDQAVKYFKKTLAVVPDNADARLDLGMVYVAMGNMDEAITELEKAVTLVPTSSIADKARIALKALEKDIIKKGRRLLDEGDLAGAQKLFESLLVREPDNAQGHYWLGQVNIKRKQYGKGLEDIKRSIAIMPENATIRAALAFAYEEAGMLDEAVAAYEEAIRQSPENMDLRISLAGVLERKGDKPSADAVLMDTLALAQTANIRDEVLNRLGLREAQAEMAAGRYDRARALFEKMLAIVPDNVMSLFNLGVISEQQQQLAAAEIYYKNALLVEPDDVNIRMRLGLLYASQERIEAAIDMLEPLSKQKDKKQAAEADKALAKLYELWRKQQVEVLASGKALNANAIKGLIDRSRALIQQRHFGPAEAVLDAMLLRYPDDAQAHYWRGQIDMKRRDYAAGLLHTERSVALMPENNTLKLFLAAAYEEAGALDKLAQLYAAMLQAKPADVGLRLKLADVQERRGAHDLAVAELSRIVAMKASGPQRREALNRLGMTAGLDALRAGQLDEAEASFRQVLEVAPGEALVLMNIAIVYLQRQQLDEAEVYYKQAQKSAPDNLDIQLALGRLYMEQEREPEAITALEQVRARSGMGRLGYEADARLKLLYAKWAQRQVELLTSAEAVDDSQQQQIIDSVKKQVQFDQLKVPQLLLDVMLERFPDNAQAHYWRGQIDMKQGHAEAGLVHIARSAELTPDNLMLKLFLGSDYEKAGQLDNAERVFLEVQEQAKDQRLVTDARRRLGLLRGKRYAAAGDRTRALFEYMQLLSFYPEDVQLYQWAAEQTEALGRTGETDDLLGKAMRVEPKNAELHLQLGKVYQARADDARALEEYKQAAQLAPAGAMRQEAIDHLGFRQAQKFVTEKRYEDALAIYKGITKVVPDDEATLTAVAEVFQRQGQVKDAEVLFKKVINMSPGYFDAYLKLARLYVVTGREDEAIKLSEQVANEARGTKHAEQAYKYLNDLYGRRAAKLRKEGRLAEAIEGYLTAIKLNPDDTNAHYNLGATYAADGKNELAEEQFREVVRLRPENGQSYDVLARILRVEKKYLEAMEAYANAIALEKDEKKADEIVQDLRMTWVESLFQDEKSGLAYRELESMRVRDPSRTQPYYFLGVLYSQQGDLDSAIKAYENVVRIQPDNIRVRFSLGILYERTNEEALALQQYRAIVDTGKTDLYVERARLRLDTVRDSISPLSSNLTYRVGAGESTIDGVTSPRSLNSTLGFNVTLRHKPLKYITNSFSISDSYTGNHIAQTDSLSTQISLGTNINFTDVFYSLNATHSASSNFLLEDLSGTGQAYSGSATVRFKDPLDLIDLLRRDEARPPPEGISTIDRADAAEAPPVAAVPLGPLPEPQADNPALQQALKDLETKPLEEIKSHTVVKGDTLWGIAELLLDDPWLWPELWEVNPDIENPHLIYPGDTISLVFINGLPKLLLMRAGQEYKPETLSVEEGMALYSKGVDLLKKQQPAAALEAFNKILEFVSGDVLTNLYSGLAYQRLQRYQEAEAAYQKVLVLEPDHQEARFYLATLYDITERYEVAIAEYERVVAINSFTLFARHAEQRLSQLYRQLALAAAQRLATSRTAADVASALQHASGLFLRDDLEGAMQVLTIVQQWLPEHPQVHYWLGRLYHKMGQPESAIAQLELAVKLAPQDGESHLWLARVYEESDRLADAEREYREVIRVAGKDAGLRQEAEHRLGVVRGRQYMQQGEWQAALDEFQALLALAPDDVAVLILVGDVYVQLERLDDAASAFEQAVDIAEDNVAARLRLAEVYIQRGEKDRAILQFKRILELDPNPELRDRVRNLLGFHEGLELIRQNRLDEALVLFEKMREILPRDPITLLNIAYIYQLQEHNLEAESLFLEVIDIDPTNLTAHFRLGLFYMQVDRLEEAIKEIELVISLSHDPEIMKAAALLLDDLKLRQEEKLRKLEAGDPVPKTIRADVRYNKFESANFSLFATYSYGGGLSFSYPGGEWGNWNIRYGLTYVANTYTLGSDFANKEQEVTLSVSRPVPWVAKLNASLSWTKSRSNYTYADTNALFALGVEKFREINKDTRSLSLSYALDDRARINLGISQSDQTSNLPAGYIYRQDGRPVAVQGASLGDFGSVSASLSFSFRF